jgi:F-type H+-transporting ATPase subunit b
MPQLDVTTFIPQLFWLVISFVLFYVLMSRVGVPKVGGVIEQRRTRIESDIESAKRMKTEIDVVIQSYERALAEARTQASAQISATKERLAKVAAERQHKSMAALAEQTKIAEARIQTAKEQAMSNVRSIAITAAQAATARLLGDVPDEALVGGAVDRVMKGRA